MSVLLESSQPLGAAVSVSLNLVHLNSPFRILGAWNYCCWIKIHRCHYDWVRIGFAHIAYPSVLRRDLRCPVGGVLGLGLGLRVLFKRWLIWMTPCARIASRYCSLTSVAGLERLRPKGFGAPRALAHDGPRLPLGQGGLHGSRSCWRRSSLRSWR